MFQSPVNDTSIWGLEPVFLEVPHDHSLRYPGYVIRGVSIQASSAQAISLPVRSFIKVREIGGSTLIELEPLLISNQELAKRISAGFPQIYIQLPGTGLTITDGLSEAGSPLGNFSAFTFAIQFSDRVERDTSHAADLILAAMQDLFDANTWSAFCTMLRPMEDILLLAANGSSFTDTKRLRFITNGIPEEFDFVPGITRLGNMINQREGILSMVNTGPDPAANCLWVVTDISGTAEVSYGQANITTNTRIILFADLFEWFAPQSRNDHPHPIPRFTRGNKVTTFVNGPDYYKDLFAELNKAAIPEGKFFLTGYSVFQDDHLVLTDEEVPKSLLEATRKIVDAGGQCYFLPLQLVQLKHEGQGIMPQDVLLVSALFSLLLADLGIIFLLSSKQNGNKYSTPIISCLVFAGAAAVMLLAKEIVESNFVLDKLRSMSSSVDDLEFENGNGKSRRIWAVHPASWDDNSFEGDSSGIAVMDLAKGLLPGATAYHQKIAVIKNTEWVAYCGGIDLNPNRMDDARHLAIGPYHDVHARVDGPAVKDLAITIMDRWNDEAPNDQVPMTDTELPSAAPFPGGHDIVQVARTNFQANPVNGGDRAFSYAPTGDRTILDTLLLTIRNAREYIYIEDQYFTPTPEYQEALLYALDNGLKSLIVIMPSEPQQPFSETVRNPFVDALLSRNELSNKRVRIGYARRNYLLPSTTTEMLTGRMMLGEEMSEAGNYVKIGPVSRVPAFPFWISVNGEMMLVSGLTPEGMGESGIADIPETDNTYQTYNRYNVERGNLNNFFDDGVGCKPRKHRAGTPVTVVTFDSIYIHAKCMMIDDMFASIGSANMNRRGFHSDAEANIFFVPDALRFAASNPVCELRKQLWAEFLNIPVSMGKTLLQDPVAASKLFDRDSSTGNRFIPLRAISTLVKSYVNKLGDISITTTSFEVMQTIKNTLSALALGTELLNYDEVFFYITDPSSYSQNPPEHI